MTNNRKYIIYVVFAFIFISVMVLGCKKPALDQADNTQNIFRFNAYRDIPGVTIDEIAAVESFRKQNRHFVYGVTPSTEAFITEYGEVGGYAALFCEWLSTLFGIGFHPEIMEWGDILEKLKTGEVDFGNLMATDEHLKTYFITDSIAERSLKIISVEGSPPLDRIALTRPVRYVILENSGTLEVAPPMLPYKNHEIILGRDYDSVYQLLKNGSADAFIEYNIAEAAFSVYNDVVFEDFFPLVFTPVSMAAENPELAPIISIVTKTLKNGGILHVNTLNKDSQ
jgi:ABC-type amino acid transport substrate-binding protein